MAEDIAQTVQKVIQDLVAPDVRELKIVAQGLQRQFGQHAAHVDNRFEQVDRRFEQVDRRLEQIEKRFDQFTDQMDKRFEAQRETSEAHFKALMAAFGEFKAQSELVSMRVLAALSERVAVLEAQRHQ